VLFGVGQFSQTTLISVFKHQPSSNEYPPYLKISLHYNKSLGGHSRNFLKNLMKISIAQS